MSSSSPRNVDNCCRIAELLFCYFHTHTSQGQTYEGIKRQGYTEQTTERGRQEAQEGRHTAQDNSKLMGSYQERL
jgi:hypothetical protein